MAKKQILVIDDEEDIVEGADGFEERTGRWATRPARRDRRRRRPPAGRAASSRWNGNTTVCRGDKKEIHHGDHREHGDVKLIVRLTRTARTFVCEGLLELV